MEYRPETCKHTTPTADTQLIFKRARFNPSNFLFPSARCELCGGKPKVYAAQNSGFIRDIHYILQGDVLLICPCCHFWGHSNPSFEPGPNMVLLP